MPNGGYRSHETPVGSFESLREVRSHVAPIRAIHKLSFTFRFRPLHPPGTSKLKLRFVVLLSSLQSIHHPTTTVILSIFPASTLSEESVVVIIYHCPMIQEMLTYLYRYIGGICIRCAL